jgi:hypothetical protein
VLFDDFDLYFDDAGARNALTRAVSVMNWGKKGVAT